MPRKNFVYSTTIIIIYSLNNVIGLDSCGEKISYEDPKGVIGTDDRGGVLGNCTWSIDAPAQSVVYFHIKRLQLVENEKNCLQIRSRDKQHIIKFCSNDRFSNTLSIPANNLLINLEITDESHLLMTYTSYIVNCLYNDLICLQYDTFLIKDPGEICYGGILVCDAKCKSMSVACGDHCYDIVEQRCDGVLDCVQGEDELSCNPTRCSNKIQCLNETTCIEPRQICDKSMDCKNGYDESNCPEHFCDGRGPSCSVEKSRKKDATKDDGIYMLIIIFGVLAILFLCMICKCLAARQNVRRLLNNPLDIPLPPFRGPGEGVSTEDENYFTEDDFKPGGDIYDTFAQNLEKIKSKRKNLLEIEDTGITYVKPPPGGNIWDRYFPGVKPVLSEELAALATIKLSRDMCHGLRKTRSEELPMAKLLFIDDFDRNISDESDAEGTAWKTRQRKKDHPKSDTSFVRRKKEEVAIV